MTNKYESLNKFLRDNDIRNANRDDDFIATRHSLAIHDGWLVLVEDMMKELLEAGWDGTYLQCKEKFGTLRFYIYEQSDKISKIIQKYEEKSASVCELCGDESTLHRSSSGWIYNRCHKCWSNNL